ncbi:RBBP9/YdeN family alpha/beta hydrolase [Jeongeupia naejangsanensis]|uniref:Alpha/beta hydrolase n=1 Tax=Jeongeupia naejangsanensis TaxID=613195 RepID=A0ABS2BRT0_9NEIS|nr:alpha/beta hydrolase [Jeongeupia naejangsanensis]MBM3117514.1 alpha/beta hydrolase [Jeongeupia naejangsanensis]
MDPIEQWLAAGNSIVVVPGWHDSGPTHWQSRWCARYRGFDRVVQQNWDVPSARDWVAGLERTVAQAPGRVIIVAHSLGCVTLGHWAVLSQHASRVASALLVAPADVAREDAPASFSTFLPLPAAKLPFVSAVIASDNDPVCSSGRSMTLARDWGSRCVVLSGLGHINADSDLDDWPLGLKLLSQLVPPVLPERLAA